jgi:hypothetical protein
MATFLAILFRGAYFNQKLEQEITIETRFNLFQAHVLSYSRMVCMGRTYSDISLSILDNWKEQFEYSRLSREMVQSFSCAEDF